jgi:hypothetical protein
MRMVVLSLASVAHTCNPSYSGGRDHEDHSLKPAWANNSWYPISKNPSQKRVSGVAQGVHAEFKPQYCKKTKEKNGGSKTLQTILLKQKRICKYLEKTKRYERGEKNQHRYSQHLFDHLV